MDERTRLSQPSTSGLLPVAQPPAFPIQSLLPTQFTSGFDRGTPTGY